MILSLDTVKRELGKTPADSDWDSQEFATVLTTYINDVEADIDGECRRTIGVKPYVEKHGARRMFNDLRNLRPNNTPIISVGQVRVLNGTTEVAKYVSADNAYSFDEDMIDFPYFTFGVPHLHVEITYTAGYTPYPRPLASLALKMVHWRYKQSAASKQGILGVSSTSDATFSSVSVSYTGLEKEIKDVCKNYIPMYA